MGDRFTLRSDAGNIKLILLADEEADRRERENSENKKRMDELIAQHDWLAFLIRDDDEKSDAYTRHIATSRFTTSRSHKSRPSLNRSNVSRHVTSDNVTIIANMHV